MRKFVVSDIHGFGNVYYAMMGYLDNLSKEEEIELYINGDLFDYGYESDKILLDIKRRIEDNKFKIVYLGGNHELMMHEVFEKRKNGMYISPFENWFNSGGSITYDMLRENLRYDEAKIQKVADFVSNLKIYHKFDEKILNKPIILVHAACLDNMDNVYDMKIKDNNKFVFNAVSTREYMGYSFAGIKFRDCHKNRIGHSDYFTIVGHTPNNNPLGYDYYREENYLNIDGGCACYTNGRFNYDHFPLVEICPGYLKILTFNSNNEIICANYFDGNNSFSYTTLEIEKAREYINKNVKIKKLSINEDGICGYWH